MSYLKSWATSFVYAAFFLAVVTFSPGLPPKAEFSDYSIEPPAELVGVLAENDRLNDPEILFEGLLRGPESFDSYDGQLYTGMRGGYVGKVLDEKILPVVKFGQKCDGLWEEEKCGRPLGLKFDKNGLLYVADAYYGIFKVNPESGKYEKLFDATRPIEGKVPQIPNSIDVADNGDVYWTDSSTEFKLNDGVFAVLADPAGRLLRYNAATGKNEVLVDKLGFPNGVKLSDDESYAIVAETMKSTIVKYHLKGPKAGQSQILIDGLPGVPDNVHADGVGNFLVSLIVAADPEHPQLSQVLAPHSNVRKMISRLMAIARLPFKLLEDLYPNDVTKRIVHAIGSFESLSFTYPRKTTVLRIDGNGKILDALHNSDEKISGISSAFVHGDYLWLGSPFNEYLARIPLTVAFPKGDVPASRERRAKVTRAAASEVPPKREKPAATRETVPTTQKPVKTVTKTSATTPKPIEATTTPGKPTSGTPAGKPTPVTPASGTPAGKPTPATPTAGTTAKKPTQAAPKLPKPVNVRQADEIPKRSSEKTTEGKKVEQRREAERTVESTKKPEKPRVPAQTTGSPKKTDSVKREGRLSDEM